MTTRSRKRKAVAELASGEFEASVAASSQPENLVAGPGESPKSQTEKLDGIKASLRKEKLSDMTKILAENQKEMLKLIASVIKKLVIHQNVEDSDSETENNHPTSTSTPINSKPSLKSEATTSKTTPISSRNKEETIRNTVPKTRKMANHNVITNF